jgi:3-methyladenine DNA glycosylase Tag
VAEDFDLDLDAVRWAQSYELIVTRDGMIIQNRNEIAAIRENNAKMVALNQRDAQTRCGQRTRAVIIERWAMEITGLE